MRKKKKANKGLFIILLIIIIVVIALLVKPKIFKTLNNNKENTNEIIGTWTTDNVTIYRFDKNNRGALIVPIATYDFTYEIKDNELYIDFENEKSTDSKYTYKLENEKLILEGSNGKFTFSKMKDEKAN